VILFEVLTKIFDKEYAMTATPSIDLTAWMVEQLSQSSPDLLWQMVQTFAEALMSADADAVCGAGYGQRSPDRSNTRKGNVPFAVVAAAVEASYCVGPGFDSPRRLQALSLVNGAFTPRRRLHRTAPRPAVPPVMAPEPLSTTSVSFRAALSRLP
jgi:hypothetical protein